MVMHETTMSPLLSTLLVKISLLLLFCCAASHDILPLRSSISVEAYQTDILQSSDGTFSCGFHSVYINAFTFSIWYSNSADRTVVWSANRFRPVHARRSVATLRRDGVMVLRDYDGTVVWQAEGNFTDVRYAKLLDTGNLVVKDSSGKTLWQSFDSPTDTLLPTQHITATTKLVSGTNLHVPGHHIFRFSDHSVLSLIYDDTDVSDIYWPDPDHSIYYNKRNLYNSTRLGVLDDLGNFSSSDFADHRALVASDRGPGIKRRLSLESNGDLRMYSLNSSDGFWSVSMMAMTLSCMIHGLCGPNGICHYSPVPVCSCPPGYKMSNPGNWSEGCRSIASITCDHPQPVKFVRLPQTDFWGSDQQHLTPVSFQHCRNICMSDCTCKGFQYQHGSGTCYPKSILFNGRSYPTRDVRTMYLKLPVSVNASDFSIPRSNVFDSTVYRLECDQMSKRIIQPFPDVHKTGGGDFKWSYFYGFIAAFFVVEVFFIAFAWFFVLRREMRPSEVWAVEEGYKAVTNHFRRYSYRELVKATRKFKDELGMGGSGIVYKGVLDDGREVAVKKLKSVSKGKEEFQAELSVIGRIYHMNLVRIWGFCSERCHRMLVSEYVENGSLANALFHNHILLDWKQRFNIALGVAKGLAYLHHECLEWVIHCDVKPENILLDLNMEPKITDFGLAKLLNRGGSNQNVSRVRGTIGYIAPEWVSGLPITAKVDVYSYGVVLLELVTGTRVSDLALGTDEKVHMALTKLVKILADKLDSEEQLWIAGFLDSKLCGQFNYSQARTTIKLAISCLEEDRAKRPTMESIVQNLQILL